MSGIPRYTFTVLVFGTLIALTAACGKDSTTAPTPPAPPQPPPPTVTPVATRITITPASASLTAIGQTVQLAAQVFDQNNNVMSGTSVTWASADPRIVSVNSGGLATAVMYGITRITARSGNASQDVEVKIIQTAGRIGIEPTEATLNSIGETAQLTATVVDQSGQTIAGADVTWRSSDTGVATVSATGLVTAVNNGTTRITARTGSTEQGITVKVMQTPTGIAIDPPEANLTAIGETIQLDARVVDPNNRTIEGASVTWQSSDETIATVSATGLVTAVNNGTARITVRTGSTEQGITVKVMQTPTGIAIDPPEANLTAIGETIQLDARVVDPNNRTIEGTSVTWQSSDETIATVSATGLVTAVNNGTARITARTNSTEQGITVKVMQTPTGIAIDPPEAVLTAIGETIQLAATVVDPNNRTIEGASVTWQSSDETVATVSADGLVIAVNNGVAAITATSSDLSESIDVTVKQTPTDIVIDPLAARITALGETIQLAARVVDPNNRTIEGASVTWQSSDASVATVSADGLVIAVDNGVAAITATSSDLSESIDVTVKQTPASIVIDPDRVKLAAVGNSVQLNAAVLDLNGHWIEGAEVTWASSDEAIATVDDQGLVTGVASGTAEITAQSGEVSSVSLVSVRGTALDRETLTALYQATNGDEWTNNDKWLSNAPLGDWYGITTNYAGEVTGIQLTRNNLRGPIPAELCQLLALERLELPWNELTGNIPPELGLLTDLYFLWLASNELTGNIPPELGQLTNLNLLWLGGNRLTGEIPSEFRHLTSLRSLDIGGNELTGVIPPELGQLTSLTRIYLLNNKLTGILPPELGQLINLTDLWLDGNGFYGTIPHELGQTKLVTLGLTGNELTGDIPIELTQLSGLTDLRLSSNRLTGDIPPELAQLTRLTSLDLGKNRLTGTILPELVQLTNLEDLNLGHNRLTGDIPPELAQLTNLERLHLDHNELTGTIPPELAQLSKLEVLWLSQNGLTGTIPPELAQLGSLTVLAIENNRFTGGIPDELGQLTSLAWLWLEGNPRLTGPLPDTFTGLTSMSYLKLFNTGLCVPPTNSFRAWIDGINTANGVQYCSAP